MQFNLIYFLYKIRKNVIFDLGANVGDSACRTIHKIDYIAIEFHDIYKNSTFYYKIKFYKTFLQTVAKPYSQWFMGHHKFLADNIF